MFLGEAGTFVPGTRAGKPPLPRGTRCSSGWKLSLSKTQAKNEHPGLRWHRLGTSPSVTRAEFEASEKQKQMEKKPKSAIPPAIIWHRDATIGVSPQ